MTTRRRLATLIAVTLAGSGGFAASAATAADDDPPQVPAAVERVHHFYKAGPSAEYGSDWGGIGVVRPLAWRSPDAATGSAIIEASFQYRTHGPGPFQVSVGVKQVGGPRVTVRPDHLLLAPAPDGGATTVRFLVPALAGGQDYKAYLGVNSTPVAHGHNKIATRKVVLTVDRTAD